MTCKCYTVGATSIYDDQVGIGYKAVGGSVWPTVEEAAKFQNHVFIQGENVSGAVYQLELESSFEESTERATVCWSLLTKAKIIQRMV